MFSLTEELTTEHPSREVRRRLRLAKNWLIYDEAAFYTEIARRLDFTPAVKESLLNRPYNINDRDKEIIEQLSAAILRPNGETDPVAFEVFKDVYKVYQTIKDKLEPDTELLSLTWMIEGIGQLAKTYITACCKRLLQIDYNNTNEGMKSRPGFKIYLYGDKSMSVAVCAVTKEPMMLTGHITVAHKSGMKLLTTMHHLLCQQLQSATIDKAGIFGIFVGKPCEALP